MLTEIGCMDGGQQQQNAKPEPLLSGPTFKPKERPKTQYPMCEVYITILRAFSSHVMYTSHMQTLNELGQAVSAKRKMMGLSQKYVAERSGITRELLVRFERGKLADFGSRKLLSVLTVLDLEINFTGIGIAGTLDELRGERSSA
jgi:predicted XRE-type DNA-binding protein